MTTSNTCARRKITKKNQSKVKTFRLFFRVRTRNSPFREKREFFYSFIFPLSLFQQSHVSARLTAFSRPADPNSSGLSPVSFHFGIAHQGRKGLPRILTRNSVSTTCFTRSREAQFEKINFFFKT